MRFPLCRSPFGVEKWSEWSSPLDNIRLSLVSQSKCVIDNYDISLRLPLLHGVRLSFCSERRPGVLARTPRRLRVPAHDHTPMDPDHWRKYFRTLKQYGLNHVRFHSYAPPKPASARPTKKGSICDRSFQSGEKSTKTGRNCSHFCKKTWRGFWRNTALTLHL